MQKLYLITDADLHKINHFILPFFMHLIIKMVSWLF